jgi:hypothetical protein
MSPVYLNLLDLITLNVLCEQHEVYLCGASYLLHIHFIILV